MSGPSLEELETAAKGHPDLLMWLYRNLKPQDRAMQMIEGAAAEPSPPRFASLTTALAYWSDAVAPRRRDCRARFDRGDREALMDMIALAARERLPMPDWAASEFQKSWERYQNVVPDPDGPASQSTLGGAFRITRPAGFNAPAERFLRAIGSAVWNAVTFRNALRGEPTPATFKAVADEFSIPYWCQSYVEEFQIPPTQAGGLWDKRFKEKMSAGKVRKLYYDAIALYGFRFKEQANRLHLDALRQRSGTEEETGER